MSSTRKSFDIKVFPARDGIHWKATLVGSDGTLHPIHVLFTQPQEAVTRAVMLQGVVEAGQLWNDNNNSPC